MRRFVFVGMALALVAGSAASSAVEPPAASPAEASAASPAADADADAEEIERHAEGWIDVRDAVRSRPSAAASGAARRLARRVGDLSVTWNDRFGTAKHVFSGSGFLSGASPIRGTADVERLARSWIGAHRDLFGLPDAAVSSLAVTRNGALPDGGPHALVFRVMYGDIPTFAGGTLGVNVARDGRIVSVWADTGPVGALSLAPAISASDAVAAVARAEKIAGFAPAVRGVAAKRADRLTVFDAGGLDAPHNARLVAFPTAAGPRLAWRVFFAKSAEEMLSTAVDATNGALLFRNNQVAHAEGKVFQNYPGAPRGGTQEIVSFDGDPTASPLTWVGLPVNATQAVDLRTTIGNNIFAWTDWHQYKLTPNLSPAPLSIGLFRFQQNPAPDSMPFAPDGRFNYDYANAWRAAKCEPTTTPARVPLPGPPPSPAPGGVSAPISRTVHNPAYIQDRDATVTNIFYLGNRIHDLAYGYGFDEEFGNFQWENFGRGGEAKDPLRFQSQAGILARGSLNNANMFTPADGGEPADVIATGPTEFIPPRSNMYLVRRAANVPHDEYYCADTDFDPAVAWHEYIHGISNRMVGGPDDADALSGQQAGSMGEAWSDWIAMALLHQLGVETRGTAAIYFSGNTSRGIRNYALDANPLTYGDFGYIGFPQVHADGEIWSATLWDLRAALIKAHGKAKGQDVALHLVFDGLAMGPRLPTYLDMRDAILAADKAHFAGKDAALIWRVFARRGMGVSAKADNSNDATPTPAFDVPGAANGIVTGVVTDADGGVVPGAGVIVSNFPEGRPNPVVTTDRAGRFTMRLQPGSYLITVGGPGYGLQTAGRVAVAAGATVQKAVTLSKNLASIGWKAAVTGGLPEGDIGGALIDDDETSGIVVDKATPVVVRLGGTGPASIRAISVSLRASGTSSLRNPGTWVVESSLDGRSWRKVKAGRISYTLAPARVRDVPRAVVPTSGLRARFVRLTVTETFGDRQGEAFEQTKAGFSGIQVYGSAPGVTAAKLKFEPPFTESGTVFRANPTATTGSPTVAVWQNTCAKPSPPIQGFDAYIVQLSETAGDGLHDFVLTNRGGIDTDLDAFFYAADCKTLLGNAATSSADEQGRLPIGSRWAMVHVWSGTTEGFDVVVKTSLRPVLRPVR